MLTVRGVGDRALERTVLDLLEHAVRFDLVEERGRPLFELVGEGLEEVGAAERIDRSGHTALAGEDLLRPKRDERGFLAGKRERFVPRHRVYCLCAGQHDGEGLQRGTDDVVVRLDARERRSVSAREEPERPRARILCLEPVAHDPGPEAAGRPVLRDLLEEVAHRRDVERETWCERVDRKPAVDDRADVGRGVGERDGNLLDGIATRLTHVIAAD
jgi:hypothetical protein